MFYVWLDDLIVHVWNHMPRHRDVHAPLSYPVAKYCWQFTVQQERTGRTYPPSYKHFTQIPLQYVPACFSIYVSDCFSNTTESQKGFYFFERRNILLSAFYIPWELPSPTPRVVSHNSGSVRSVGMQIEEWRKRIKKGKLSKGKRREAKLSSQGHHLKKQNKK